jgi:hypothetical protein
MAAGDRGRRRRGQFLARVAATEFAVRQRREDRLAHGRGVRVLGDPPDVEPADRRHPDRVQRGARVVGAIGLVLQERFTTNFPGRVK